MGVLAEAFGWLRLLAEAFFLLYSEAKSFSLQHTARDFFLLAEKMFLRAGKYRNDYLYWKSKQQKRLRVFDEQVDANLRAVIPDPTEIIEPSPVPQSAGGGPPESGSGRPWGSDKCVLMRCYRPGPTEDSKYQVVALEKPVLIHKLRFVEQHVAYQTLLAKAPADEIHKHYGLHLKRLKRIREAIGALAKRLQRYHPQNYLDLKSNRRKAKSLSEIDKLEEGFLAYKKLVKSRDRLRAYERAVATLLVQCEDAGKGEPGFEKVDWQTGQGGNDGDKIEGACPKE